MKVTVAVYSIRADRAVYQVSLYAAAVFAAVSGLFCEKSACESSSFIRVFFLKLSSSPETPVTDFYDDSATADGDGTSESKGVLVTVTLEN